MGLFHKSCTSNSLKNRECRNVTFLLLGGIGHRRKWPIKVYLCIYKINAFLSHDEFSIFDAPEWACLCLQGSNWFKHLQYVRWNDILNCLKQLWEGFNKRNEDDIKKEIRNGRIIQEHSHSEGQSLLNNLLSDIKSPVLQRLPFRSSTYLHVPAKDLRKVLFESLYH